LISLHSATPKTKPYDDYTSSQIYLRYDIYLSVLDYLIFIRCLFVVIHYVKRSFLVHQEPGIKTIPYNKYFSIINFLLISISCA
jgi:hypothetical protein